MQGLQGTACVDSASQFCRGSSRKIRTAGMNQLEWHCSPKYPMRLLVFTPPNTVAAEHIYLNHFFAAGLETLHVRKPSYTKAELRQYLQRLNVKWHHRIVLHQHHDLAAELSLKGIHFKEKDRPDPPLGRIYPGLSQSTSLHTLDDVLQDWQNLDYAFLSPIFNSISKSGYTAAGFEHDTLINTLHKAQMPVYALGGITSEKLHAVHEMGFAGIGVLGAVWAAKDPLEAFHAFHTTT